MVTLHFVSIYHIITVALFPSFFFIKILIKPSVILEKGRAGSETPPMDKEKKGREGEGVVLKKIDGTKKQKVQSNPVDEK